MIISYANVEGTRVLGFFEAEGDGPIETYSPYRAVAVPITNFPDADSPTKELHIDVAGNLYWVETAPLPDVQARAIFDIDQAGDAARLAVVGDAARIKEYERAQLGAEQYRDSGYVGSVPSAVASWAYAKRRNNWTARQAAEDILAASARWYAALDGIRALRLDAKEAVRAASTCDEVAAIVASFCSTLAQSMQGVQ